MRKGFTLIEILTVVAIIGVVTGATVLGLSAGTGASKLRGATRDVFAAVRLARSEALVTGKPCVITYSTVRVDGEPCAKIDIVGAKLLGSSGVQVAQTLSGERVRLDGLPIEDEKERRSSKKSGPHRTRSGSVLHSADENKTEASESEESSEDSSGGESLEDILFAPISEDVVRGVCLKVTMGDDELDVDETEEKTKTKISVFSNVDYLIDRYKDAKKESEEKERAEKAAAESVDFTSSGSDDELQAPVSVGWEVNGQVKPHRLWIYLQGEKPESGLSIKIDRFGAAKVLSQNEEDD